MSPQTVLSNSGFLDNGLKHFLQFPTKLTNVNRDGFALGEIPSVFIRHSRGFPQPIKQVLGLFDIADAEILIIFTLPRFILHFIFA
jgi:hypothetical protein